MGPNWNPHNIYCWSLKELQGWFDANGAFGLYNGKFWKPISKRLCPGRYEVRFKEKELEEGSLKGRVK